MFEEEKKKLINAGIKLDRYGLVALSGGNVTLRMTDGTVLVTPSGMVYEDMVPGISWSWIWREMCLRGNGNHQWM